MYMYINTISSNGTAGTFIYVGLRDWTFKIKYTYKITMQPLSDITYGLR